MVTSSSPHITGQSGSFRSYPQKYPRAAAKASEAVAAVFKLIQKGPQTLSGIVVDISFHLTQGYVYVQLQSGLERVYGVPYGAVVPQMRVFCRQIGAASTNRAFVFDGFGPNVSTLKQTGSVLFASRTIGVTSGICQTTSTGMPVLTSLATAVGYYWHCFFYLPDLPTQTVTLFQMAQTGGGANILTLEYLTTGFLRFRSQDGHGYISSTTVAPHQVHWLMIQPGLVTIPPGGGTPLASDVFIDGVINFVGLLSPTDLPTFTARSTTFAGTFLSNNDGSAPCSLGSWVSKFGYGTNFAGGSVIGFVAVPPTNDSQIPLLNIGIGRTSYNVYLCTDTPGSATVINSNAPGGGSALTLTSPYSQLMATGPY